MPLKCYPLRRTVCQTIHRRITDPGSIIIQGDFECSTGISATTIFNQDIHIVCVAHHKLSWDLIRVIETLDLHILDLKIGMEEVIIAHENRKIGVEIPFPSAPFHLLSISGYAAAADLYRLHSAIKTSCAGIAFYRRTVELQCPRIIIAIREMMQCVVGGVYGSIEPCSVGTGWEIVPLIDPVLCL